MYDVYLKLGDSEPVHQFMVEGHARVVNVRRQLLKAHEGRYPVVYTKHAEHGVYAATWTGKDVAVSKSPVPL